MINPVLCISHPHHTSCPLMKYTLERILLLPDPSLANFSRYVQTSSIHHVQEGHPIMWTVVRNFPTSRGKKNPVWHLGMEIEVEGKVTPSWDGL